MYLIIINTDTCLADAIPVESKSFGVLRQVVIDCCMTHRVLSLVHDGEASFCCQKVHEEPEKIRVSSKLMTEHRHAVLDTIGSFIMALRDMDKPGVTNKHQSDYANYRDSPPKQLAGLLRLVYRWPLFAARQSLQGRKLN